MEYLEDFGHPFGAVKILSFLSIIIDFQWLSMEIRSCQTHPSELKFIIEATIRQVTPSLGVIWWWRWRRLFFSKLIRISFTSRKKIWQKSFDPHYRTSFFRSTLIDLSWDYKPTTFRSIQFPLFLRRTNKEFRLFFLNIVSPFSYWIPSFLPSITFSILLSPFSFLLSPFSFLLSFFFFLSLFHSYLFLPFFETLHFSLIFLLFIPNFLFLLLFFNLIQFLHLLSSSLCSILLSTFSSSFFKFSTSFFLFFYFIYWLCRNLTRRTSIQPKRWRILW